MIAFLLAATIVPAGQVFTCTPVRVWDGDGPVWCAEGPRIRLAAIAAREIDGTCRRGQPCPDASGTAARDALVQLLGGATGRTRDGHVLVAGPAALTCRSRGSDAYHRTVAWCSSPATGDLSCALVKRRVAVRWARFSRGGVCH